MTRKREAIGMGDMRTQRKSIEDLRAAPYNPREIADEALAGLGESLRRFGCVEPIIWNEQTGNIVGGHQRVKALTAAGVAEVDVVVVDLSDSEEKTLNLTLNNPAIAGDFIEKALAPLLEEVKRDDPEGYEALLLARLGVEPEEAADGQTDADAIPDVGDGGDSECGAIYGLGKHRLMCGDSTSADDVSALMDGHRAGLMNTDPPYGVSYANETRPNPGVAKPRVANDDLMGDALEGFLASAFSVAKTEALTVKAAWYLWHAATTRGAFMAATAEAIDFLFHREIIWVKPVLLLGRGQYHMKHETCIMGWQRSHQPPDYGLGHGERTQTTVWEVASISHTERAEFNHATPKPVGLFTIPIVKHLKPDEIAFEPFAGSGPQFIACEQLRRRCYGLELEPRFCSVIRRRWAEFVYGPGCDWKTHTPREG